MTDLAENTDDTFIPLKTLSHRRNLSVKYLEQILIQLGKSGLVTGSRGTNGGYKEDPGRMIRQSKRSWKRELFFLCKELVNIGLI